MTKKFFEIPALFLRTKKCSISFKTKLVVLYPILIYTLILPKYMYVLSACAFVKFKVKKTK